ncbi:MAG: hypothetical protein KatS3mg103_0916 [Phycisphaerales bacterium]|nr:MAG: hypothetical protein KatS3mg103_0916 [Phycisphaerales bacterium]
MTQARLHAGSVFFYLPSITTQRTARPHRSLADDFSRSAVWLWAQLQDRVHGLMSGTLALPCRASSSMSTVAPMTRGAGHLGQLLRGPQGSAGGKKVVHQQHPAVLGDVAGVDLQAIDAVLQLILDVVDPPGQLAGLADGDEPPPRGPGRSPCRR